MAKIGILLAMLILFAFGNEKSTVKVDLTQNCLLCHQTQQIPDALIYRRYLMKYSTDAHMEEAIFSYLKDPNKVHSIMPAPFFLKFPMKEKKTALDDKSLQEVIQAYLEKYDLKKKLVLEK